MARLAHAGLEAQVFLLTSTGQLLKIIMLNLSVPKDFPHLAEVLACRDEDLHGGAQCR